MASLYETLGTRVEPIAQTGLDPGTTITKMVETVDDDHATTVLALMGPPNNIDPGTMITRAVETVDDDHASQVLGMLTVDPESGPGTALTAAVEEVDPDRIGEFHSISRLDA